MVNIKRHTRGSLEVWISIVVATSVTLLMSITQNIKPSPSNDSSPTASSSIDSKVSIKINGKNVTIQTEPDITSTDCKSTARQIKNLSLSKVPQIKKLAEYNQICDSSITTTLSYFTPIPTTSAEAVDFAANLATDLKEFHEYDITPLIFLEPTTDSGGLIDMEKIADGTYDAVIDEYFSKLEESGITDKMMGTWVHFPEGNIPVWSSLDPGVFTDCIVKIIELQKEYFPRSKASIMLDTLTYPSIENWDDAEAVSFMPYIQNIPEGLIDSFGLQGFPWLPPADDTMTVSNGTPHEYLRVDLAQEAAELLEIDEIWLNTGTFGTKYSNNPSQKVTVSPATRLDTLNQVIVEAKSLQSNDFKVSVHLFAEDKSETGEATDWSYWPNGQAPDSPSTYVFQSFVHDLQDADIPLWLFDANSQL